MLTDDFAAECERIAIQMRRELKLWGYDPLPARRLAEHMEIQLLAPSELNMTPEDVEQAVCSTGWSAITVLTKPYKVIYHPYVSMIQFESNIMHELAHVLRGHKPEQLGLISDFRVARKYSKRQEYEADALGLALQFPQIALHYVRQRKIAINDIVESYSISLELAYNLTKY